MFFSVRNEKGGYNDENHLASLKVLNYIKEKLEQKGTLY